MYGIRYYDGDIDLYSNLRELRDDLVWIREAAETNPRLFGGAEPVVRVGTNPADYQWETFEDARVEIPNWWWETDA